MKSVTAASRVVAACAAKTGPQHLPGARAPYAHQTSLDRIVRPAQTVGRGDCVIRGWMVRGDACAIQGTMDFCATGHAPIAGLERVRMDAWAPEIASAHRTELETTANTVLLGNMVRHARSSAQSVASTQSAMTELMEMVASVQAISRARPRMAHVTAAIQVSLVQPVSSAPIAGTAAVTTAFPEMEDAPAMWAGPVLGVTSARLGSLGQAAQERVLRVLAA